MSAEGDQNMEPIRRLRIWQCYVQKQGPLTNACQQKTPTITKGAVHGHPYLAL